MKQQKTPAHANHWIGMDIAKKILTFAIAVAIGSALTCGCPKAFGAARGTDESVRKQAKEILLDQAFGPLATREPIPPFLMSQIDLALKSNPLNAEAIMAEQSRVDRKLGFYDFANRAQWAHESFNKETLRRVLKSPVRAVLTNAFIIDKADFQELQAVVNLMHNLDFISDSELLEDLTHVCLWISQRTDEPPSPALIDFQLKVLDLLLESHQNEMFQLIEHIFSPQLEQAKPFRSAALFVTALRRPLIDSGAQLVVAAHLADHNPKLVQEAITYLNASTIRDPRVLEMIKESAIFPMVLRIAAEGASRFLDLAVPELSGVSLINTRSMQVAIENYSKDKRVLKAILTILQQMQINGQFRSSPKWAKAVSEAIRKPIDNLFSSPVTDVNAIYLNAEAISFLESINGFDQESAELLARQYTSFHLGNPLYSSAEDRQELSYYKDTVLDLLNSLSERQNIKVSEAAIQGIISVEESLALEPEAAGWTGAANKTDYINFLYENLHYRESRLALSNVLYGFFDSQSTSPTLTEEEFRMLLHYLRAVVGDPKYQKDLGVKEELLSNQNFLRAAVELEPEMIRSLKIPLSSELLDLIQEFALENPEYQFQKNLKFTEAAVKRVQIPRPADPSVQSRQMRERLARRIFLESHKNDSTVAVLNWPSVRKRLRDAFEPAISMAIEKGRDAFDPDYFDKLVVTARRLQILVVEPGRREPPGRGLLPPGTSGPVCSAIFD